MSRERQYTETFLNRAWKKCGKGRWCENEKDLGKSFGGNIYDWIYTYEGYVICVVYPNGYDIIAPNGQFYYSLDPKGQEHYKYGHSDYSGETEWSVIIEQYITNH